MCAEAFTILLGSPIDRALEEGQPLPEVHDCPVVAGMVLDDRRPHPGHDEDDIPY
jgi:hypothetical protein